jgi:hypothetical protein
MPELIKVEFKDKQNMCNHEDAPFVIPVYLIKIIIMHAAVMKSAADTPASMNILSSVFAFSQVPDLRYALSPRWTLYEKSGIPGILRLIIIHIRPILVVLRFAASSNARSATSDIGIKSFDKVKSN